MLAEIKCSEESVSYDALINPLQISVQWEYEDVPVASPKGDHAPVCATGSRHLCMVLLGLSPHYNTR